MKELAAVRKLAGVLAEKKKSKVWDVIKWVLLALCIIAACAAVAYLIYRFVTPDYDDDFEEDYDDDFDDDFFEEEEEPAGEEE